MNINQLDSILKHILVSQHNDGFMSNLIMITTARMKTIHTLDIIMALTFVLPGSSSRC